MPTPHREQHDGYLATYLSTGQRKIIGVGREVEGRRKDVTTFPMDLVVSEFHVAGRHKVTGVIRDITERKQVERLKDEFVPTVNHELRTPLTSIRGASRPGSPQVLDNLLSNAAKYSPASCAVEVQVRSLGDELEVSAGGCRFLLRLPRNVAAPILHSDLPGSWDDEVLPLVVFSAPSPGVVPESCE